MWIEVLLFFALLFLYVYRYVTGSFDEFKKQGIPYAEPSFPFGSKNAKKMLMGETNFFDGDKILCENEFKKEKIFGYFVMAQPTIVINDEELAKAILVKDFEHFTDLRSFGYESSSKDGMLVKYMFTNMKGDKWKKVRSMMSGVFTSGKLKIMAPHIIKAATNMDEYLVNLEKNQEVFEARDLGSMFTMDAFASAGFGIEENSFANPENVLRRMALSLVGAPGFTTGWDQFRMFFIITFPNLSRFLGVPNFPKQATKFVCDLIERTYAERKNASYKVKRNDIIDFCIEEMEKSDHFEEFKADKESILVANMVMLFFAGFDTQAITISQILHNLVKKPQYQDKIIEELDEAYERSGGEINYDMIEGLKYMDMVFKESMRYNTLFVSHERVCTKDYKIPGTDFVIPKGRVTHVYFGDIVTDNNNYINPLEFDPENFNPDNFTNKFSHMGFGQGPRACPASRYAYMAVKIFLARLFKTYKVIPCEKTNMGDAVLDPHLMFAIKDGVHLKIKKREF